eukprot:FR738206.1.p1 GENE.FR738206.1~~FR738206.1.p1  ORF type:complete len:109 (-),score=8.46 FR738206.1:271-597(-)
MANLLSLACLVAAVVVPASATDSPTSAPTPLPSRNGIGAIITIVILIMLCCCSWYFCCKQGPVFGRFDSDEATMTRDEESQGLVESSAPPAPTAGEDSTSSGDAPTPE